LDESGKFFPKYSSQEVLAHELCFSIQGRRLELMRNIETQFRESMAAPEWELEDYKW